MKKTNYIFILLISLLFVYSANAQQRILNIAHQKFEKHQYVSAQEAYLRLAKREYRDPKMLRNLADSYYLNGRLEEALSWYKEYLETYPEQIEPEYYFRYAQCLKSVRDYATSDQYMDKLLSANSNDIRAKIFDKRRDYLGRIDYQSERYDVKNSSINSELTDFGTAFYGDTIVFSSSRDTLLFNQRLHKWTGEPFLELYRTSTDSVTGILSKPKTFSKELSTRFHEGTPVFTKDNNTLYFTGNHKMQSKNELIRLKIYRSYKNANGKWSTPEDLPINNPSYSTSHPSLSPDGRTLYFSSDMSGGFGMSDLYSVSINEDGSFGTPENLGNQVNTEGKETFPFATEEALYFSSDGHPGLGGLDVFWIPLNTPLSILDIANVGKPINSPKDDFAYTIHPETDRGYFSSNRDGGMGGDDIYSLYEFRPIRSFDLTTVLGTVIDKDTKEGLQGATIAILDEENNVIQEVVSKEDGQYYFYSKKELSKSFSIKANKEGYLPKEHKIERNGYIEVYERNIELEKENELIALEESTNDFSTGPTPLDAYDFDLTMDPIHFEENTLDLKPEAKAKLDIVADLLKKYPKVYANIKSYLKNENDPSLAQNRAKAIQQYLMDLGIPQYQLSAQGVNRQDAKLDDRIRLVMVVPMPIQFEFDSDEIQQMAEVGLDKVISLMRTYPNMNMEVHSHADSRSSFWYNKNLSVERMRSTISYLTDNGGIYWRRIRGRAYGERRLANDCADDVPCSEEKHQQNRRSEFVIND